MAMLTHEWQRRLASQESVQQSPR